MKQQRNRRCSYDEYICQEEVTWRWKTPQSGWAYACEMHSYGQPEGMEWERVAQKEG